MGNAAAYIHEGYWEDIGTVESFYKANMSLTQNSPSFSCHEEGWPIFSSRYHLPGPKISNARIIDSIICEGSLVEADELVHTVLGPRSVVKKGCIIRHSYLPGNVRTHKPPIQTQHIPKETTYRRKLCHPKSHPR